MAIRVVPAPMFHRVEKDLSKANATFSRSPSGNSGSISRTNWRARVAVSRSQRSRSSSQRGLAENFDVVRPPRISCFPPVPAPPAPQTVCVTRKKRCREWPRRLSPPCCPLSSPHRHLSREGLQARFVFRIRRAHSLRFSTCVTPMVLPALFIIGTQSMERVK